MSTPTAPHGFTFAQVATRRRIILALDGLEKQGKTHFALTAPGPIAYMNFDDGDEGVVDKFVTDKQVVKADYRISMGRNDDETSANAKTMWQAFVRDYEAALTGQLVVGGKKLHIRTIVWDTATETWELLRLFRFGKLTQVMPHHYGPVNAEYRRVVRKAFESDVNLILLHKLKAEYENKVNAAGKEVSNKTGRFVRAGFSEMAFLAQMNAIAYRDESGFNMLIKDCRQNMELAGQVIPEPMLDFPTVAGMVFPDSSDEDWR